MVLKSTSKSFYLVGPALLQPRPLVTKALRHGGTMPLIPGADYVQMAR